MTTVPDVSVVVAVYNTMPYLTACLTSLVEQSIGRERLEIIAVDDGSTDTSGKELDRFAELYPDTIKVIHQDNSGGPAHPSNRALEQATGRFVYFVGSDDHLGTEALERLVAAADTYDSDVVIGKMVGVNGRYVHQDLFKSTNTDIGLADAGLAWSLSNCKLFRRELVERHGLRFRESMPVCSDQPFTIEACVRARRISVLADYDYYYAVRRTDSSNITFRTPFLTHLRAAEELIEFTVGLIGPGPERDAILRRHFTWEMAKLVDEEFPDLDRAEQEELCSGVRRMADRYLTQAVLDKLEHKRRVRVCLAQQGAVDTLCAAIRQDVEGVVPPIILKGGHAYSGYPGFGDERLALPDDCFKITTSLKRLIGAGLRTTQARWESGADGKSVLAFTVGTTLLGADALDPSVVSIGLVPSPRTAGDDRPAMLPVMLPVEQVVRQTAEDGSGTDLHARIPLAPLVARQRDSAMYPVGLYVEAGGTTHELPVPAADPIAQLHQWHRISPYRISLIARGERGRMAIAIAPIRTLRVVRLRLQRLVNRGAEKES